ncbi:MAG: DUF6430 domain-containing protein [Paludibacteraceae bacterium]|nr:DUF6430 domain-containing protein [Paludibacteraceae bacterium]
MKQFFAHFVAMLAALSSVATLITFATGVQGSISTIRLPIGIGVGILLICTLYATIQTWRKKKIELNITSNLKLTIQQADLFKQNGIIVIGFNEYFDTHVGDGIVSSKTLHGIFINKYYKDHIEDLDADIKSSLAKQEISPKEVNCQRRHKAGKTDRYELGTCALVHDGGKKYVLVALTHFDEHDKANLTREEFNTVLSKLMFFLSTHSEANEVHMPILGTGLARLNRSESRILHFIIDSLDFLHAHPILGGLFIDILSLKSAGVNLNAVEDHFKKGIKEEAY